MQTDTVRYLMCSDKHHQEIIRKGLEWLLSSDNETLLFYVPDRNNLCDKTYIVTAIGDELCAELDRNLMVLINNKKIYLITPFKMEPQPSSIRLLAIWGSSDILTVLEKRYKITNMLVIPWNRIDVEEWQEKHNPIQLFNDC